MMGWGSCSSFRWAGLIFSDFRNRKNFALRRNSCISVRSIGSRPLVVTKEGATDRGSATLNVSRARQRQGELYGYPKKEAELGRKRWPEDGWRSSRRRRCRLANGTVGCRRWRGGGRNRRG